MANRKIRIGVQLQPQHAQYAQLRDAVRRAEEVGIDIVYNWDHFYPLYGDSEGLHFESFSTLAAWGEQTQTVEFGPLVACNSYRNPNLLADIARTIDHISGGRFILGIGSGWFEKDYDRYGYEFGTAGSRLDQLATSLPIIIDRLTKLNPAPLRKIPILIGGGGEKKTLPLVAKYADIWHYFVDEESYQRKSTLLDKYAKEIGRNPDDIEHSAGLVKEGVHDLSPAAAVEQAKKLLQLGVTQFTFGVSGPDYDLSVLEALVAWRDTEN